jgi:acetyl esterase/lipase
MKFTSACGFLVLFSVVSFAQDAPKSRPAPTGPPFFLPARPSADVDIQGPVAIGKGGDKVINAYIAQPKNPPPGLMPAIIYIHGGGWRKGFAKSNEAVFLVPHGYFTASIDYRLDDVAPWPAQIEDCKLGVRWLRANAARYHVDPNRIGCMGHSAGGHLVNCLGTMDDPSLEGDGGYPGVSSKVQAVVALEGPTNFDATLGPDKPAFTNAGLLDNLLGGTFAQKPDAWKQASPLGWVKAGDPPFLVVHGDHDVTVPYSQAVEFVAALKNAGVPAQLLTVRNGSHMIVPGPGLPPTEPSAQQIRDDIAAFFDKILKP